MQKFVSTKELYTNFKKVSEEVQNGTTFIVLKYSQPAYKITPLEEEEKGGSKKYRLEDLSQFVFKSKNKEKDLATSFKKYIYA